MIIKNLSWNRFNPKSLLEYVAEEEKALEEPIYWNILGKSKDEVIQAFEETHAFRNIRKNSVMLHHDIISFAPENREHLTPDKLRDLTYKYLELRAKHNLAFAQIHQDKGHLHVHMMISPNPVKTPKVTQIKRKEYFDIRRELEAYQQSRYPELENSIVFLNQSRNQDRVSNKVFEIQKRNGISTKKHITELIHSAYASSHSIEEFHSKALQLNGVKLYIRGNRYYGVEFEGKKYRFTTLLSKSLDQIEAGLRSKEKSIVDDLIAKAGGRSRSQSRARSHDRSDDYEIEL